MPILSDALNAIIESADLSDPREIAEKIEANLTAAELPAALHEALPVWVRTEVSRGRLVSPLAGPMPATSRTPNPHSAKVAAVRDDWQRRIRMPIFIGGVWKRLAECTADDLLVVAEDLRARAAQTVAKAEYYERVAAAIPAGGTVADLPGDPTREDVAA